MIVRERERQTTSVLILTLRFVVVAALLTAVIVMFCIFGFEYVTLFRTSSLQTCYAGYRRGLVERMTTLSMELIMNDSVTWAVDRPPQTAEGALRALLRSELDMLLRIDRALHFGGEFGLTGCDHTLREIDDNEYGAKCGNTSQYSCMSLKSLLSDFVKNIQVVIGTPSRDLAMNMSAFLAIRQVSDLYAPAPLGRASELFKYQFSGDVDRIRLTTQLGFGLSIPVIVLFAFLIALSLSGLENESRRMKFMLLHLPPSLIDDTPAFRDFVVGQQQSSSLRGGSSSSETRGGGWTVKTAEERTRRIVETSSDAIVEFSWGGGSQSAKGLVEYSNAATSDLFRVKLEDLLGRPLEGLFAEDDAAALHVFVEDTKEGARGRSMELRGKRRDESGSVVLFPVRILIGLSCVSHGVSLYVAYVKDMTEEKRHDVLLLEEKQKSENLLLNVIPRAVASRLRNGEKRIADSYDECTLFFSDIVGFTSFSSKVSAAELVALLDDMVSSFDALCRKYRLEKIKTIGDAYFCVSGVPTHADDDPSRMMNFAIEALQCLTDFNTTHKTAFQIRIGINTGQVVGGVIGHDKFSFDLWGDAVNLASRMESTGLAGRIQISRSTYEKVFDQFKFEERDNVEVKGKGKMTTYLYVGRKEATGSAANAAT